ncbi:MAG: hypothetical protein JRN26_06260 [Nitrososphaerota archaeon]|jgi:uncharacterized membrane protein|nr:hypothetical protein [Nitrososphaerota archaeon]MDG6927166.1 hypothetical protein [Nitrososphaerota archaeon]MDG6931150.1 hypothetical protein [Nitrososphaerota archaeon]MDG6932290.1 hypothetical protein [Nitrososphaerota archaeon]MDG6936466.1 hypothetical protein [Nitrososphaerota archaeon]
MAALAAVIAWFHIFFAICWLGSALFFAVVLGPVISSLSPQSRGELLLSSMKRIEVFELVVSTMTVLFGVLLVFSLQEFSLFIIFGATFGITAYLIGLAGMTPLTRSITRLLKMLQNEPQNFKLINQLANTNKKFRITSIIELVFMLLAVSSMVAAGFL